MSELELANVLTPDAPGVVLARAIADYERLRADVEGWPYPVSVELTDEEADDALELMY